MHRLRYLVLTILLLVLATKNSAGQSEDDGEEVPSTCSDDIEMCKDDYGNSQQTRQDVLLYKTCMDDVRCDGNDDDTALKDKEVAWAKKNVLHYSLIDDRETNVGAKLASRFSYLSIILFSFLLFIYQRIQ